MVRTLKDAFYVDICVKSVSSETEFYKFRQEASMVMSEAKFDLTVWQNTLSQQRGMATFSSALGLLWDRGGDTLSCAVTDSK
jgi:hypothetical protein